MADASPRTPRAHAATVLRTERLGPNMVRVVLGGSGMAAFPDPVHADSYVKILFPRPDVDYPHPFDLETVRATLPAAQWPRQRAYTVRRWDPAARELTLDVVVHGDQGLAGPWAAAAQPGDEVHLLGPGGAYSPDPAAGWHLLAGDESALPAIAAAVERLPANATARILVEVGGPADEQPLDLPVGASLTWLHRGSEPVGEALVAAVRALEFPSGDVHAFVHGEAGLVRELRQHLRRDRGITPARLSISGYWRLGADDEAWRAAKREWNRQVELEEQAAGAA